MTREILRPDSVSAHISKRTCGRCAAHRSSGNQHAAKWKRKMTESNPSRRWALAAGHLWTSSSRGVCERACGSRHSLCLARAASLSMPFSARV